MTIQQAHPVPPSAPADATPPADANARVTPMMEQYLEIKAAHPGLLAVLPDGRFLRAVLRGRRDRLENARHRADQARQASGHGYPDVRRAGGALRGLSASPDQRRPPRRGVRADRGSGRRPRPRQQERGGARRGAAGDAGHADRGHAARCAHQQLSAGDRARPLVGRRRPLRARLDRHFDLRVHGDGMRERRTRGDAGAHQSERGDRHRRALWRRRVFGRCCANCRR